MSIFGKRSINCPADRWTVLEQTMGSGMARSYQYEFEGERVDGEFRLSTSVLPFCLGLSETKSGELESRMTFEQGWFDVSYRLEVKPTQDLMAKPR